MNLRRSKRFSISTMGRYRRGTGVRFDIAITDLSETGCQFSDLAGRLQQDDVVTLRIGSIGPIPSRVVWITKRTVGVEFEEPLHPSVLEHIIAAGGENRVEE